jgi:transposase
MDGREPQTRELVIGVDTHKDLHVAVAVDHLGVRLGQLLIPTTREGYAQLEQWGRSYGKPTAVGIEGTGSYGAGLARFLRQRDYRVIEVNRPDRASRHRLGKTDPLDAEAAARAVLAGVATAIPKAGDGTVELIRVLKVARDTAVRARSQALITLKTLVVTAPATLREELGGLADTPLVRRCAGFRPGPVTTPEAATKHALQALARRWLDLHREVRLHDAELDRLTQAHAPALRAAFGIGTDTAAELLIVAGDNPHRIRSDAAFAALCGVCPLPASSGQTTRHRLNRGGHRQANAALYRVVIVRMRWHQPTVAYVKRRLSEGKTKAEIIRCLKRYVAREVFRHLVRRPAVEAVQPAA